MQLVVGASLQEASDEGFHGETRVAAGDFFCEQLAGTFRDSRPPPRDLSVKKIHHLIHACEPSVGRWRSNTPLRKRPQVLVVFLHREQSYQQGATSSFGCRRLLGETVMMTGATTGSKGDNL